MAKERIYATAAHPVIEAVIGARFRFETVEQARVRLNEMREKFVAAKRKLPEQPVDSMLLWIKGFGLTQEQIAQNFTGHFALITIEQIDDRFMLKAILHDVPLDKHPQKKRPKQKHPDWGHPTMRAVRGKRVFETFALAQKSLDDLHADHPEVTIPGEGRLLVILYEKEQGRASPVQKYKLAIGRHEKGFTISVQKNTKPMRPKLDRVAQGHFTEMVAAKKKRNLPRPTTSSNPQA